MQRLGPAVDRASLLAGGRFPRSGEIAESAELAQCVLAAGRGLGVPDAVAHYERYLASRRTERVRSRILADEGWRRLRGAVALRFARWLWLRVWLTQVAELVLAAPSGDAALRERVRSEVGDARLAAAVRARRPRRCGPKRACRRSSGAARG